MEKGNGMAWTWVVASLPGIGDVAFQIPGGFLSGKLPEEFSARRLTHFRVIPKETGGSDVILHKSMFVTLDSAPEEFRMRASAVAWWAVATEPCRERLDGWWCPVKVPSPRETARILKGPQGN